MAIKSYKTEWWFEKLYVSCEKGNQISQYQCWTKVQSLPYCSHGGQYCIAHQSGHNSIRHQSGHYHNEHQSSYYCIGHQSGQYHFG